MLFWIVAAAMTFAVCLLLLTPLARERAGVRNSREHELEVYKDQLREIDRDRARGLIEDGEAEMARAEIGRKVIRLSEGDGEETGTASSRALGRWVGAIAVLSLPLVSWGLYAATGSPDYPGQPLQARLDRDPSQQSPEELIARAEAHLAANPGDARGWDVLAPIYLRLGRFDDAAGAFANAIRLDEPTPARLAGQGEALTAAANGRVSEEAQALFSQALDIEPGNIRGRYFIALASAQAGDQQAAERVWRQMLSDLPDESPWHGVIAQAMNGTAEPSEGANDQAEMIEGMVASLATRLEANHDDVDGWQQLIRSYMVLDRQDDAQDALDRARNAYGAGSPEAGHLAAYGLSLGLNVED
ncbi:c-type cytochrome biogenesis protein CcmI [Aliihoeflea aestuarii]|jgi:cytochrome c-type biogenesis protein CcmH|uniref:c-type cytochrome biogenesis protein CcmI n=1 Tax=Aliihoeflea aestuarii TaxID=453840 RepID=UPI0020929EFE|nr:c-type cytochrome biogenesis protein CcmI [Aliihoeflea aestuarii]MCO6389494.1 c-type cytochrome biogenesis protein CcmI [Aliihoeflea aestuarii]